MNLTSAQFPNWPAIEATAIAGVPWASLRKRLGKNPAVLEAV